MMGFKLGEKSLKTLAEVKEPLQRLVKRAIEISKQDFVVFDGLRTIEEQKKLVATGKSKTMSSKHLTGDAVDLVPWVNGKAQWLWPEGYMIADAMKQASIELGIPVVWGGNWSQFMGQSKLDAKAFCAEYVRIRQATGKSAFVDCPHYQLIL